MTSLPAAAANRSAAIRTVEEPFDEDHWILDTGTDFDMCPSNILGIRTERSDLGAITAAKGRAYPDHTITTNIDAIQERAEFVTIDGLTVRLLSVGRRCRKHSCRFCWEPCAEVPSFVLRLNETSSQSNAMANPSSPPSSLPSATLQTMTNT